MFKRKRAVVNAILCLLCVLWAGMIFFLSAQNGEQTAAVSAGIAQKIAEIIYTEPVEQQVQAVHLGIRKLAHIGLFFIWGLLLSAAALYIARRQRSTAVGIVAAVLVVYAFFDEWHKIFVDGRHFSFSEAVLNAVSGLAAIVLTVFLTDRIVKKRKKDSRRGSKDRRDVSCI